MSDMSNPPQYDADGIKNPDHALIKFLLILIDNILEFSKTANDHRRHLYTMLNCCVRNRYYRKLANVHRRNLSW